MDQAVAVDPRGERFERLGVEVHRAALGLPGAGDQARVLEDLDVLRDRLEGDVEGLGDLVHRGRSTAEVRDDRPPDGVGEGGEAQVDGGARVRHPSIQPNH